MRSHPAALIDVRTRAEWQFVGLPDMNETPSTLHMISWKRYPDFSQNEAFLSELEASGVSKEMPCFFICRSGGRSLDAAIAAHAAGWQHCFNIEDGFEGEPDGASHRGKQGGWKAAGLAWRQS